MPKQAGKELYEVKVESDPCTVWIRERLNRGQIQTVQDAGIVSQGGGNKNILGALWNVYVAKWDGPDFQGMECIAANWNKFDSNPLFDEVDAQIMKRWRALVNEIDGETDAKND
jgi:hypothetical protein